MSHRTILALLSLVCFPLIGLSQAPDSVSFQGFLTNTSGEPLNSVVNITTTFYKGGVAGYTQLHSGVTVDEGLFNLNIGPVDTVRFDQPIDVGVTIGADPEIVPRTPLQSAPFALGLRGLRAVWIEDSGTASYNIVGGAENNAVGSGAVGATISGGGGLLGSVGAPNTVDGDFGTIGGGFGNAVPLFQGTVSGGSNNTASRRGAIGGGADNVATGTNSVVGGGYTNNATASGSAISGGHFNTAEGELSAIGGGESNTTSAGWATVGGGSSNIAEGANSTVPGGSENRASGEYSFAAGLRARALHTSSFVWNDGTPTTLGVDSLESTGPYQFLVKASGGVWFYSNTDTTSGVFLPSNMGSWVTVSSADAKAQFAPVDGSEVLEKLAGVPVQSWRYKTEDAGIRHMGPTAQDFYAAFGLGPTRRGIATVDADGVALAAIQELYRRVEEQQAEIERLKRLVESQD